MGSLPANEVVREAELSSTAKLNDLDRSSGEEIRAGIADRLRARRPQIEQAILVGIRAVPDPAEDGDAEYLAGLRAAVTAVVGYGLTGIEQGEDYSAPIPPAAVAQVCRAARAGVGRETVLRRYLVGHTLLADFVMQEAERGGLMGHGGALRHVQRTQESLLNHLITAISAEYERELRRVHSAPEQRLIECVRRLLAGEHLEIAELCYELDAWHLGVIATGARAAQVVQGLANQRGRRLLSVAMGQETVWAWFGGQRRLGFSDIERALPSSSAEVSLAVGETAVGVEGFRLTHRQAQAALLVAQHRPQRLTRFVDVALVTPWLQDDELARSLVELYLSPLDARGCTGATLRETLRAYFKAGRNASAAASCLGISRRTMRNRQAMIEEGLGSLLHTHQPELELALRLAELLREDPPCRGEAP